MVNEEMHLQENTLYDLDLVVKVTQNVVQYPAYYMTYAPAKFETAASNSLGEDGFTRKYIIWPRPWGQGHTKCCPVASTSCPMVQEKMHLQENTLFDLDPKVKVTWSVALYPLHHVTYAQAKFKVATSKSLWEDAFTRKYIIWPLTLILGSRSHKTSASTLDIMWPMHRQNLKLLLPKVYEEMHLQENTLFDLWPWPWGHGLTKCRPVHLVIYASTKFEVATFNGLGEDTITRNETWLTDRQTDARTDDGPTLVRN